MRSGEKGAFEVALGKARGGCSCEMHRARNAGLFIPLAWSGVAWRWARNPL